MSLSGSSASRKSIWAITRLARSSSMNVGRKMIRSLSSREKMSKARSPRGVCSITMGTRAMNRSFSLARRAIGPPLGAVGGGRRYGLFMDFRIAVQELGRHTLAQPMPQPLQVAALLHHTPDRRRWALAGAGDLFHLGLEVRGGGGDALALGDGFHDQRGRSRDLVAGQERVGDLVFQRVAVLAGPARLELLEDLGPQRLQRLELAQ